MRKEELVNEVMEDVYANMYNYHDWIMDVVQDTVKKWSVKELKDFLGEEE